MNMSLLLSSSSLTAVQGYNKSPCCVVVRAAYIHHTEHFTCFESSYQKGEMGLKSRQSAFLGIQFVRSSGIVRGALTWNASKGEGPFAFYGEGITPLAMPPVSLLTYATILKSQTLHALVTRQTVENISQQFKLAFSHKSVLITFV